MAHGSSTAVITALIANAILTVLKFAAALLTHSASMMNEAIHSMMDSLNRHFLSVYGNDWVRTPNLARFAARSVTFDNHWIGSAPCMPARRDILAGRFNFLERE